MRRSTRSFAVAVLLVGGLTACGPEAPPADDGSGTEVPPAGDGPGAEAPDERRDREDDPAAVPDAGPGVDGTPEDPPEDASLPPGVSPRPDWLGTRPLPVDDEGFGEVRPTPDELRDRRLPPPPSDLPPPDGEAFDASVARVPDDVRDRSTWQPDCPVDLDDLRYLTLTFWGFDDRAHTGELLVHASAADDLVGVFRTLYEERFPLEEVRVIAPEELDLPPTGDGNVTTAFVCRPIVGSTSWSQHAYGLAVDLNPFHNPYRRGERVLPELASAYLDRDDHRPGMIQPGDAVTRAFADIGWGWGGDWTSLDDWMHFSSTGR